MISERVYLDKEHYNNMVCPVCGKSFHLKHYSIARAKNHYCSKECFRKAKSEYYMAGENNHQYGLKGKLNASWKSDRKISRYGYIQIRMPNHPFKDGGDFVFEHRLVAEQYLLNDENSVVVDGKKYLSPEYCVHHIDFDRTNNSPDNLLVMKKGEHMALHCKLNPCRKKANGRFCESNGDVVKFKKTAFTATYPTRATDGSAGYDLYVDIPEAVSIEPGKSVFFDTHIAMEPPKGFFGALYSRSSIAAKRGIRLSTCVSVIDNDYRGSIGIYLYNDTNEMKIVSPGERVAQIVLTPYITPKIVYVDELSTTERGMNGFGSTGK